MFPATSSCYQMPRYGLLDICRLALNTF
jgi:hypothetical protein